MIQQNNHFLTRFLPTLPPKGFLLVGRWLVSALCLGLIGWRLAHANWQGFALQLKENQGITSLYLFLALALVSANLGLEASRWRLCLASVEKRSWRSHVAAVLAGISVGLPLTHLVGDYSGKLALARKHTAQAVPLLVASSFSQYWVSFFGGWLGLTLLLQQDLALPNLSAIWIGLTALLTFLFVGYFSIPWVYRQAKKVRVAFLDKLPVSVVWPSLSALLGLSGLRYLVIITQYACLFACMGGQGRVDVFLAGTAVALAIKTLVPFLSVGGMIGIRELLALTVLGSLGFGDANIVAISLMIWLMNVALPAFVGSVVLSRVKSGVWWQL
jgi:hypothetical protein